MGTHGSTSSSTLDIVLQLIASRRASKEQRQKEGESQVGGGARQEFSTLPEQAWERHALVKDHRNCCPSQGWPVVYPSGTLSVMKFSPELIFLWPFSRINISPHSISVHARKQDPFFKTLHFHLLNNCHNKCKSLQPL